VAQESDQQRLVVNIIMGLSIALKKKQVKVMGTN
jgi:hypothetical protein